MLPTRAAAVPHRRLRRPGSRPYGGDPYGGSPGSPYGGPDPLAGMPPLAPFGKRLAARVIDVLIIAIPLAILSLGVGGFDWSSDGGDEWATISPVR